MTTRPEVSRRPAGLAWAAQLPGQVGRRALAAFGVGGLGAAVLGAAILGRQTPSHALGRAREISLMTWPEVRDAVAAGMRTVIVPSGGVEQNGPHMVIGKHDFIAAWGARRIAAELGDALVAPVISYVPQGEYDPPTGNMRFPGTIGVPAAAFAGVLDGIARSLRQAGFTTICFIADHGQSIGPQAAVAATLTAAWQADGVRVLAVDAFYAEAAETALLAAEGETLAAIGSHATIADTSELMAVYPDGVDLSRLAGPPGGFAAAGIFGDPRHASTARGDALMALKIRGAVAQIKAATGHGAA